MKHTVAIQVPSDRAVSEIDHRLLKNMFQKSLLWQRYLVKLIDIDERKPIQIQFCIPFMAEINAVCIVSAKRRRNHSRQKVDL